MKEVAAELCTIDDRCAAELCTNCRNRFLGYEIRYFMMLEGVGGRCILALEFGYK